MAFPVIQIPPSIVVAAIVRPICALLKHQGDQNHELVDRLAKEATDKNLEFEAVITPFSCRVKIGSSTEKAAPVIDIPPAPTRSPPVIYVSPSV